ncbi:MAG: HNH endonuclease [Rhodoferax sp.]|uniref:HNH endonuclease signature motif containing protein n=1 Tax=Rhodoferax sp. TaxID=50421 RepID=UPI002623732F|nr:HNH endonuclease [Rhodoferax sp.]MDD5336784.1 HNH endonuclease [Rhodoferax sp.]
MKAPGFAGGWLLEAFYERGLKSGLPYLADGTPVVAGGVTYASFVQAFRDAHRLNHDPKAREVCVFCGGPLGDTPHVDHWINKGAFPLLSVCADNLQLICSTCNEAPNKGDKPVHSAGSFADWFHPFLRHANGTLALDYVLPEFAVKCTAAQPEDQPKVDNLDRLLNLADRWTREFKAEYAKQQDVLRGRERRRVSRGQARHSQSEIQTYVQHWKNDLLPSEPHHEVHQALCAAMLEPARLAAWHNELGLVS